MVNHPERTRRVAGNCLNMSMCAYTTGVDSFTVVAWNPAGQKSTSWLALPVSGDKWQVTDLASQSAVPSQTTLIDNRTHQLPLLYLNKYRMKPAAVATAEAALANKATHLLNFAAELPPVGYSTFTVKKAQKEALAVSAVAVASAATTVSNGVYTVTLDMANGLVSSVKNIASGAETALNLTWGYCE
jgi:hypothetical protein